MADPVHPQPLHLVAEALVTKVIPGELSTVLAGRLRTVCEDGAALPSDKCLVWGIHSFLSQLVSVGDHILNLEQVNLIGVDLDGMVHLLHPLLSVLVDLVLTSQRLFVCQGELPSKVLPPVVEVPYDSLLAQ